MMKRPTAGESEDDLLKLQVRLLWSAGVSLQPHAHYCLIQWPAVLLCKRAKSHTNSDFLLACRRNLPQQTRHRQRKLSASVIGATSLTLKPALPQCSRQQQAPLWMSVKPTETGSAPAVRLAISLTWGRACHAST